MLTATINSAEKYDYLGERFRRAFEFLRETDFKNLSAGIIEIDGENLYAEVQEYQTKPERECPFESHRKYFDIQYMADGEEYFGFLPIGELEKDTGYDETRDLEFYRFPEVSGRIHLKKGDFAVVSPDDGHQPRCIGIAPCRVKKIVVKVRVGV